MAADCDADHTLVCSKVKLRTEKEGRPSKTRKQDKVEEFARALEESFRLTQC